MIHCPTKKNILNNISNKKKTTRPPIPLPYRPLSAGPIMHQNRHRLRPTKEPASRSHDHLAVINPDGTTGKVPGQSQPRSVIGNNTDNKNEIPEKDKKVICATICVITTL